LFKKLDADERLLKAANIIEVPPSYLEYVTSNYDHANIPYSSLEKALALIDMDASVFKNEGKNAADEEDFNIDDIFQEFEA
jgi:hypothetical protein